MKRNPKPAPPSDECVTCGLSRSQIKHAVTGLRLELDSVKKSLSTKTHKLLQSQSNENASSLVIDGYIEDKKESERIIKALRAELAKKTKTSSTIPEKTVIELGKELEAAEQRNRAVANSVKRANDFVADMKKALGIATLTIQPVIDLTKPSTSGVIAPKKSLNPDAIKTEKSAQTPKQTSSSKATSSSTRPRTAAEKKSVNESSSKAPKSTTTPRSRTSTVSKPDTSSKSTKRSTKTDEFLSDLFDDEPKPSKKLKK